MWNTTDEIGFINSLGTHRDFEGPKEHVIELLKGYLSGCQKRTYWGKIDRYIAVGTAKSRLMQLRIELAEEIVGSPGLVAN